MAVSSATFVAISVAKDLAIERRNIKSHPTLTRRFFVTATATLLPMSFNDFSDRDSKIAEARLVVG